MSSSAQNKQEVSLLKGGDIFLILLVLCGTGFSLYTLFTSSAVSQGFTVRYGDRVIAQTTLHDTTFTVQGDVGTMTIQIKDEKAEVLESSCVHQICVKNNPIAVHGRIICVPNRISIEPQLHEMEVDAYVR